jgi:hypothetical protein
MARPKRVFTDEEEAIIANYALDGGKNNTIASALCIPVNTLTNRFSGLLKEYRAFRKLKLARNQTRLSVKSPQMAIFLGTNELGQVVKQVIVDDSKQRELDEAQKAEAVRIASIRLHQESA